MPVNREGDFEFLELDLYGGIRQDLHEMSRRYTCIKNMHHARLRALTKNTGYRLLNTASDITSTPKIDAGLDVRFNNGTQKVYVLAGTDTWIFNASTLEFDAQSRSRTQSDDCDLQLHANEVYMADGTKFEYHDGSTWTAVSGSPPLGTMLATHNNRLIVSGRSSNPWEFYYGNVRGRTFDTSNNKVIVGGTTGEVITSINELGDYLFVGTRTSMWLYKQSAANPKDWDEINLSENIGPINDRSVFMISRQGIKILCFWTDEGPACVFARGGGSNTIGWKPLWEPLTDALEEQEIDQVPAISISKFDAVSGGYQHITQQACFGVWSTTGVEADTTFRYDLRGLIAYINGQIDQPVVCVRNNSDTGVYPCEALFQIQVDRNGLLSTSGKTRLFGGRSGQIFELDAPGHYTDGTTDTIPVNVIRDGFSGAEEGVSAYEKVATKSRVRGTQNTGYALSVTVSADGGQEADNDSLSLDAQLGAWGDGGVWTSNAAVSKWNAARIQGRSGHHGVHGQNFKVQIQDLGTAVSDFELTQIGLEGHIYEKQ